MKKIILLIVVLMFLTGCSLYNLNYFTMPNDADFLALIKELDTPEKIGNYMEDNFIYEFHNLYALDPYTLWKVKKGDCNEFVTFGTFIANYHGYTTYQLGIFYKNLKHRIAIYEEDNYYSITDNQYYYPDFDTFKDIVEFDNVLKDNYNWTKYIVYDYWNNIVEKEYNN